MAGLDVAGDASHGGRPCWHEITQKKCWGISKAPLPKIDSAIYDEDCHFLCIFRMQDDDAHLCEAAFLCVENVCIQGLGLQISACPAC